MIDLNDVAVLVEAVAAGSLAGAARRLGIGPMVASRRLAALEDELGVRLVHRTTRALSLTPEGEAFWPYAQTLLENATDGRAAVRPAASGAAGRLRVTSSVPFARKVVAPMMGGFLRDNPALEVELVASDAVVDIVAQGLDLAIRIAPLRDSTLIARRVAPNPRLLVASPAYLALRGTPRRVAELADHDCLTTPGTGHWSFTGPAGPLRQRVRGRFTATSIDALQEACIDGLGLTIIADWNVRDDLATGRLRLVTLEDGAPEPLTIWAIHPTTRFVPPKVRLFVAALEAHLGAR